MIKNLLIDLGGVIMTIKRQNCIDAFKAIGFENPEAYLTDYEQKEFFHDVETGHITPAQFRDEIRKVIGKPLTDEQIDTAFNAFLVGIPEERLDALTRLRKKYNIYMLSNTNPIMWVCDIKKEFAKQGHDVDYYFDDTVTSFEAGVCKPDARIFEFAIEKLGIKPEETLFLDDSEANCRAGEALGFHAECVTSENDFVKIAKKLEA